MIFYFHGFASSGSSTKVDKLRERFGNDNVIAPDLPFDPKDVCQLVNSLVLNFYQQRQDEKLVFVGTSLGAFYANYFGHLYDSPLVLVNPSVQPNETMKKRLGVNKNYATGEEFLVSLAHLEEFNTMRNYIDQNYAGNLVNLFLAKDDDVIPYELALDKFKFTNSLCVTDDGGHRFDTKWYMVMDKIEEILKNN